MYDTQPGVYDTQMAATLVKSIRISPELWAKIEGAASTAGRSANATVVNALEVQFADLEGILRRIHAGGPQVTFSAVSRPATQKQPDGLSIPFGPTKRATPKRVK